MKKTMVVLAAALAMSAAILLFPTFLKGTIPKTGITRLREVSFTASVSASGEIQRSGEKSVTARTPMVLGELLVQEGDTIKAGDVIATVDKEETIKRASSLGGSLISPAFAAAYAAMSGDIPEEVRAAQAGTIQKIKVREGDFIQAGSEVATMDGTDGLAVSVDISEKQIASIAPGQEAAVSGSGFPSREYHGIVEEVASSAKKTLVGQVQDTVVEVKIRLTDADESIRPGYSAKVKILTSPEETMLVVPFEAVGQDDENREFVYVFKGGTAVKRVIETGREIPEGVQVLSGISRDDAILLNAKGISSGEYVLLTGEE